jgi:Protein of unknown function (DUF3810)
MTKRRAPAKKTVKRWPIVLLVAAFALAVAPLPAALVEQLYSRGLYNTLQPAITFTSNLAPFAWLDVLAVAVLAAIVLLSVRDIARHGWSGLARAAFRILVVCAAIYVAFALLWGLNYRRERLPQRLAFNAGGVTAAAAARLAAVSVERVNRLHSAAHSEGWMTGTAIDPALAGAFDRVSREIGAMPRGVVVGRPKRSLIDWYFQRAGVAGMTDPLFLETIVAGDLLPFERPMIVAHEWAHLAGLANEGEANLAGWLSCIRGSIGNQYSGWLFMYDEAIRALPADDRPPIIRRLGDGPRTDLSAIRERLLKHVNPQLASAGWRVYDSYLKANRVESGTQSYSEVVRLALGLEAAREFR